MGALAVRNLWERKLRAALTSLAIVLGVMMVAGTYVLTDTIDRSFERIFTESNEGVDAVVNRAEAIDSEQIQPPPFSDQVLDRVRGVDGVAAAAGGISDPQVSIVGADGETLGGNGAPSLGFSVLPERFDPLTYVEGGRPAADDEVVIDKASADDEGFEVGDDVRIAGKEAARY
jgi:putative ABC transport system permease protein